MTAYYVFMGLLTVVLIVWLGVALGGSGKDRDKP